MILAVSSSGLEIAKSKEYFQTGLGRGAKNVEPVNDSILLWTRLDDRHDLCLRQPSWGVRFCATPSRSNYHLASAARRTVADLTYFRETEALDGVGWMRT